MLLIIIFSALAAFIAHTKGYAWKFWIYPMGLIGLIVIALTTPLSKIPEQERLLKIKSVNKIGLILTSIAFALSLAGVIAAILIPHS